MPSDTKPQKGIIDETVVLQTQRGASSPSTSSISEKAEPKVETGQKPAREEEKVPKLSPEQQKDYDTLMEKKAALDEYGKVGEKLKALEKEIREIKVEGGPQMNEKIGALQEQQRALEEEKAKMLDGNPELDPFEYERRKSTQSEEAEHEARQNEIERVRKDPHARKELKGEIEEATATRNKSLALAGGAFALSILFPPLAILGGLCILNAARHQKNINEKNNILEGKNEKSSFSGALNKVASMFFKENKYPEAKKAVEEKIKEYEKIEEEDAKSKKSASTESTRENYEQKEKKKNPDLEGEPNLAEIMREMERIEQKIAALPEPTRRLLVMRYEPGESEIEKRSQEEVRSKGSGAPQKSIEELTTETINKNQEFLEKHGDGKKLNEIDARAKEKYPAPEAEKHAEQTQKEAPPEKPQYAELTIKVKPTEKMASNLLSEKQSIEAEKRNPEIKSEVEVGNPKVEEKQEQKRQPKAEEKSALSEKPVNVDKNPPQKQQKRRKNFQDCDKLKTEKKEIARANEESSSNIIGKKETTLSNAIGKNQGLPMQKVVSMRA